MTLIELLVCIMVIGLIATVLAATITVVLRQAPETTARVDSARWEQNLGTWMPADLTSAEWPTDEDGDGVPDDPTQAVDYDLYEPCGDAMCTWGENVVHLAWDENGVAVDVSYRYGQTDEGTYEFRRVECRDGSCSSQTLVRDMPEPSSGGEPPISVTFPPDVLDTDPNGSPVVNTSGRRVSVTVRSMDGTELLSFTGGGTERMDLEPAAIQPPEFLQARSGCGGPITLIVDESTSLSSSNVTEVRKGVRSFVETFAGTPTQLQVIGFNHEARVLNPANDGRWNHWFDLSEQSVVDSLLGSGSPIDTLSRDYATNWEDALYRALYTQSGQTYEALGNPANPAPELVVFFTDGLPTYDRTDERATPSEVTPALPAGSLPARFDAIWQGSGAQFSPRSWYRASWLRSQSSIRMIGVGVGDAFSGGTNLDNDTTLGDSTIRNDWSAPYGPGGSYSGGSQYRIVPAEVILGDLIAGNDVSNYAGDASDRFIKVSGDGGWDAEAVKEADVLTTTNFAEFGGALESIALAECGGTLTVQTRLRSDTSPLRETVGYEVSGENLPLTESSTSAVNKSAPFDISTDGGASADILLKPRTLDGTGYRADGWTCRSKNVEITDPSKMSLHDGSAGPAGGIDLTVAANEAVACVLWVVPS